MVTYTPLLSSDVLLKHVVTIQILSHLLTPSPKHLPATEQQVLVSPLTSEEPSEAASASSPCMSAQPGSNSLIPIWDLLWGKEHLLDSALCILHGGFCITVLGFFCCFFLNSLIYILSINMHSFIWYYILQGSHYLDCKSDVTISTLEIKGGIRDLATPPSVTSGRCGKRNTHSMF